MEMLEYEVKCFLPNRESIMKENDQLIKVGSYVEFLKLNLMIPCFSSIPLAHFKYICFKNKSHLAHLGIVYRGIFEFPLERG
jgi:hypothetical protein